jgi:hypothetical protein
MAVRQSCWQAFVNNDSSCEFCSYFSGCGIRRIASMNFGMGVA